MDHKEEGTQYAAKLISILSAGLAFSVGGVSLLTSTPSWLHRMANDQLLVADPLKGPAGTNEWTGLHRVAPSPALVTGNLAESWEIDVTGDIHKLKFKIRKGVYWHDKPPMNGAELTPEDVVYNYRYVFSAPGSYFVRMRPYIRDIENPSNSIYVDPDDPRTEVFEAPPANLGSPF